MCKALLPHMCRQITAEDSQHLIYISSVWRVRAESYEEYKNKVSFWWLTLVTRVRCWLLQLRERARERACVGHVSPSSRNGTGSLNSSNKYIYNHNLNKQTQREKVNYKLVKGVCVHATCGSAIGLWVYMGECKRPRCCSSWHQSNFLLSRKLNLKKQKLKDLYL